MEAGIKRQFSITVSDKEFPLLEIVYRNGPCTSSEVYDHLHGNLDLLEVMRILHDLMDRGLIEGMMIDKQRLYRVKTNYKNIRSRLIKMDSL
jgi:predicted transcriptional regulator